MKIFKVSVLIILGSSVAINGCGRKAESSQDQASNEKVDAAPNNFSSNEVPDAAPDLKSQAEEQLEVRIKFVPKYNDECLYQTTERIPISSLKKGAKISDLATALANKLRQKYSFKSWDATPCNLRAAVVWRKS
jgi:hypothetical protein